MTNEYITKAQAIDLAESMRNLMAKGVADAFIKGIEGLEGCRLIKHRELVDGKTIAIKLSPEIANTLRGWISTKGRLPEARETVLIHHKEIGVFEAFFTDDGYWETDSGWWSRQRDVTHWMPLPKPPKE